MRILIATPLYFPDIGGPATYTKFLEENLSQKDFDLLVIPFSEVRRFPYLIRHVIFFFKVLRMGKEADIIYALDPLGVGVPAGLAAKFLRKRFFMRIAGDRAWETATQKWGISDSLDDFSRSNAYSSRIQSLKKWQTFGAKLAEKIIVPSEYLKKIISNWGIRQEKIHVIYNAFEHGTETETKEEARKKLSLSGTILVSSGRLVPWKGFEALMQIMPKLLNDIPDAVLYIAGDGPDQERLFAQSYDLRQKGRVVFLGALPKETLLRYIQAADVFLLNTFYEGFSHQLLEAMSLGVPVVSTSVGGNPELIESEKDGILVGYNDRSGFLRAILRLVKDKEFSEKLGAAGKEKIWRFSPERAIVSFIKECQPNNK